MTNKDNGSNRRNTGILTARDEEVLSGDSDLTRSAERDAKYRIREKVKQSFEDLSFVFDNIGEKDRELIFDDLLKQEVDHIATTLALIYMGIEDSSVDRKNPDELFMESLGVSYYLCTNERGELYNVDLNIDVERTKPDEERLFRKIKRGDGTYADFVHLHTMGSVETLYEYVIEEDTVVSISMLGSETDYEITPRIAERRLDSDENE
ncbi:hypothetical protein [Natrinema marinum]|uniref:hypothetical protein n=1 Tax=Natrinema marinum TaxID=2961598 RepID=UPI0020C91012|nr:hypothetical protein [Natrinema marinum]